MTNILICRFFVSDNTSLSLKLKTKSITAYQFGCFKNPPIYIKGYKNTIATRFWNRP